MKKQPRDEMVEKLEKGAVQALDRCFSKYDCVVLPRPVHNVILDSFTFFLDLD